MNLMSAFHCCHFVIPYMLKGQYGSIVNIASTGGLDGVPTRVDYSAAKAGMIGMTRALAKEYAKNNILVNCIAPGIVDTDIITFGPDEEANARKMAMLINSVPVGRLARAEEIGACVAYAVSARFLTGQTIAINGGSFHH